MISISFWARGDNSTANNASINSLNTSQFRVTELTFVAVPGASEPDDPYGDIILDPNNGGVDPDTQVIINGIQMDFTVEFSGRLPITRNSVTWEWPTRRSSSFRLVDNATILLPTVAEHTRL